MDMNRIEEGEYGDRLGLVQLLALTLLALAATYWSRRATTGVQLTTADFH